MDQLAPGVWSHPGGGPPPPGLELTSASLRRASAIFCVAHSDGSPAPGPIALIRSTETQPNNNPITTNVAVPVPAPTVITKSAVSLADHLDLRNLPLATTPAGKNFAMKCLHPADPEIKSARVPGGKLPSLGISLDLLDTIPFPPTATAATIIQTANLGYPVSLVFVDANGAYVDHYVWTNSALGGMGLLHAPTTMTQLTGWATALEDNIDSYRVTAQSVTVDVIAPAVADQGTIVSAQFSDRPLTSQPGWWSVNGSGQSQALHAGCDVWLYDDPPPSNVFLMGTSAYSSKARDGVYQPLKLDKFKWVSIADGVQFVQNHNYTYTWTQSLNPNMSNYPIYSNSLNVPPTAIPLTKPSCHVVGMTWIEGTAGNPQVSLRIRVRQCAEILPVLGATYAPLTEAPYPPDDLAMKMVVEIGARMKDAYPASYNDLGKLKSTIQTIGRDLITFADPVLGALELIPGAASVARVARSGLSAVKALTGQKDAKRTSPKSSGSVVQTVVRKNSKSRKKRKQNPRQ